MQGLFHQRRQIPSEHAVLSSINGFTSLHRCSSPWRMRSLTSLQTASLLVSTARKPFVNSSVELFLKTSSFENSRLGDAGFSFDKEVEFQPKLGVGWKVTRPVVGAGGVCRDVSDALIVEQYLELKSGAFAEWEREATDLCGDLRQKAIRKSLFAGQLRHVRNVWYLRCENNVVDSFVVLNLFKLQQLRHKYGYLLLPQFPHHFCL